MKAKPHPEQGFRSCLGNIGLAKSYGVTRLEAASRRGNDIGATSYGSIASILDDWGLSPVTLDQARDLLEIIDDRHGRSSTIVTSQLAIDHWRKLIPNPTIADAILDRLVHNAHRLVLNGESIRKNEAKGA